MENFDYFSILKIPFKIFKIAGLWPGERVSTAYSLYGVAVHLIGIEFYLGCQIAYLFEVESLFDLCDMLSVLFTYFILCLKSLSFIVKRAEISRLLEELKGLISTCESISDQPLTFLKPRVLQVQTIFRIFWGSCLVTTIIGGLVPVVTYIADPNPPYKSAYKATFPFDTKYNIYGFVAGGIYQAISPVFFCGVVSSMDLLPIFFFNSASGLLEELSAHLSRISSTKEVKLPGTMRESANNNKQLENCIEFHIKLKQFISNAGNVFSPMIAVQGAVSLIILCTSAFTLSKMQASQDLTSFMRLIAYMVPMVLQILNPCFFGNEISIASNKLSSSLFNAEWYNSNEKFRTATKMFMENTKNQIKVTAADGIFQVDLATFLRILNSAYSLYAVLQRIN